MKPIIFLGHNKILNKPENMTDNECGSLPVLNDDRVCISCWSGNIFDRIRFLFTGVMWLGVLSGKTQPPVYMCTNKPFYIDK